MCSVHFCGKRKGTPIRLLLLSASHGVQGPPLALTGSAPSPCPVPPTGQPWSPPLSAVYFLKTQRSPSQLINTWIAFFFFLEHKCSLWHRASSPSQTPRTLWAADSRHDHWPSILQTPLSFRVSIVPYSANKNVTTGPFECSQGHCVRVLPAVSNQDIGSQGFVRRGFSL